MGKSIENGVIKQLSPSMINAFDASTTFGCERRAWYKYVKGLEEPQKGNQALGEALHALIEERLKTGVDPQVEHEAVGLYLAGKHIIEDVAKRKVLGVEKPIEGFTLDGIRTVGYIDCVTEDGIIDWKTSSDIKRYGKTAEELAEDTQMVLYAKAMHPTRPTVKLAHGQFQTKGSKRANFVEVEVTQEHLDSHLNKVILPLVRRMKEVATVEDINTLPRNDKACFNCHFASHCPSSEGNTVMSFFKKMNAQSVTAAVTNSDKPVVVVKVESPTPGEAAIANPDTAVVKSVEILPPDAPKSDPKLAAAPVEGFEALPPAKDGLSRDYIVAQAEALAPAKYADIQGTQPADDGGSSEAVLADTVQKLEAAQVKRGRGRPPGSKNKPKTISKFEGARPVTPISEERMKEIDDEIVAEMGPNPNEVRVKSVTVSKGFTVNLGSFNNVRFDVSVTAEGSDLELVYSTLMGEVEERLNAEASKYEAEVDQKNKTMKPATEVIK